MNARPNIFGLSGGPLAQAVSVLVFAVLLVGAVVMGAVLLAVIVGVAVLAWIALSVRLWWLRRKLGRGAAPQGGTEPAPPAGRLIEAEYTVLDERDPRRGERDGEGGTDGAHGLLRVSEAKGCRGLDNGRSRATGFCDL